jgi:hypothetical protein
MPRDDTIYQWQADPVRDHEGRNWGAGKNKGYQMSFTLNLYDKDTKQKSKLDNCLSLRHKFEKMTPELYNDMLGEAEISAQKMKRNYKLTVVGVEHSTLIVWRRREAGKKMLPRLHSGNIPKQKSQAQRFEPVDGKLKHWRDRTNGKVYSNGMYVRYIKKGDIEKAKPLKR